MEQCSTYQYSSFKQFDFNLNGIILYVPDSLTFPLLNSVIYRNSSNNEHKETVWICHLSDFCLPRYQSMILINSTLESSRHVILKLRPPWTGPINICHNPCFYASCQLAQPCKPAKLHAPTSSSQQDAQIGLDRRSNQFRRYEAGTSWIANATNNNNHTMTNDDDASCRYSSR